MSTVSIHPENDGDGRNDDPAQRLRLKRLTARRTVGRRSIQCCFAGWRFCSLWRRLADRRASEQVVYHLGWKYVDKKIKQWTGYKVHVTETVDPEQPIKKKGEPTEHFIAEMFTTEAAQDEMAGLTEVLKREQQHHEITPQAVYSDAGYVTEHTLTQAEQNGIPRRAPTRTRERTIAMHSRLMSTNVRRFVPRESSARSAAASKIALWELSISP